VSEGRNIRVLLVEDDEEDSFILRRYLGRLKERDVDVTPATTEEEARRRLAAERFDLVFVDIGLGDAGSGLELLKHLQREGAGVPRVVVTGSGDERKAVEAMKSGAYDYVVKGDLCVDLLERTVRNALKRHSLERERIRMVDRLQEWSVTDELTGVANRRCLVQKLEEETRRCERFGCPFALLLIDLDHFKLVNDRYGHPVGDNVLKDCAAALECNSREIDLVARYGGEEFCVLLPETSLQGGRVAAEKLRKAVKALPDPVPTISVGVACWQEHVAAEELLRRADEALYKAKEAGRDRVVLYDEWKGPESGHGDDT